MLAALACGRSASTASGGNRDDTKSRTRPAPRRIAWLDDPARGRRLVRCCCCSRSARSRRTSPSTARLRRCSIRSSAGRAALPAGLSCRRARAQRSRRRSAPQAPPTTSSARHPTLSAVNPAQRLSVRFLPSGPTVRSGAAALGLSLRAAGYDGASGGCRRSAERVGEPRRLRPRDARRRGPELSARARAGVHHPRARSRPGSARVTLALSISYVCASLSPDGRALVLQRAGGRRCATQAERARRKRTSLPRASRCAATRCC